MKHQKIICSLILISMSALFSGCSQYTQEDIDVLNQKISELENQNATLENQNTTLLEENKSLQALIAEYKSKPSVPAGMDKDIFAYGLTVLNNCDDYLVGNITVETFHNNISDFMGDILLSNRSKLNPIDSECIDNMIGCYAGTNYIIDGYDVSEQLIEYRNALADNLGIN